jgi:hypothetical protein
MGRQFLFVVGCHPVAVTQSNHCAKEPLARGARVDHELNRDYGSRDHAFAQFAHFSGSINPPFPCVFQDLWSGGRRRSSRSARRFGDIWLRSSIATPMRKATHTTSGGVSAARSDHTAASSLRPYSRPYSRPFLPAILTYLGMGLGMGLAAGLGTGLRAGCAGLRSRRARAVQDATPMLILPGLATTATACGCCPTCWALPARGRETPPRLRHRNATVLCTPLLPREYH